jgi:MFS family permease
MPPTTDTSTSYTWLSFALFTVICWGTYGVFLASGSEGMHDPANGRMKAFLFVGVAYFLAAVLAPLLILVLSGANWNYPVKGMTLSLIAGIVGALGALGILLALNAAPKPVGPYVPVIMTIIFALAPVLNAIIVLVFTPPSHGWQPIRPLFWVGMLMAIAGGAMVTMNKPMARKPVAPAAPAAPAAPVPAGQKA